MSANGYKTKLNKVKRAKVQNLSLSTQSFGMKMNNQHATHKDRVSFGGPWKIIKNYFALTGETVVYRPVAGYDLTLADIRYRSYVNEEEKREKEQDARIVVKTYAVASATSGGALSLYHI